jgi:lysophospholipase L1-like esterase
VAKVGLVLASAALALPVCEIVLRVTGVASVEQGVFTVSERDFERLPGIWEPDQEQIVRDKPALPHRVTTNALGYRGEGVPLAKPGGQLRVLYVGDSFTFGSYVDDDESMPARLQHHLASVCGDVAVINAGLGGSTITEHRPMIERGLQTRPDLVVLQFSENDVTDLAGVAMWDQLEVNRRAKSRFPLGLVYPVLRRTALWGLVLRVRAEWTRRRTLEGIRDEPDAPGEDDGVSVPQLRERYASLLEGVVEEVTQGVPMVFVVYPSHNTLYGITPSDQVEWVAETAAAEGLPVVNLLPPLAETGAGAEDLYLLPHDGHPSARGYDVSAAYLARQLLAEPLLEPLLAPTCDRSPARP